MIIEIKVPSPGESITEVQIAQWLKQDGDYVEKDEVICEIDSDKATLTLNADAAGTLKTMAGAGDAVKVGAVICTIDTDGKNTNPAPAAKAVPEVKAAPANESPKAPPAAPATASTSYANGVPSVAAKKIMDENNVNVAQVNASGKEGRITKGDVLQAMATPAASPPKEPVAAPVSGFNGSRDQRREKMTMLRKKVAQRLVAVKNETAMLTTFNEVDMSPIMNIRKQYKDKFKEAHGVNLGFMSFFTKAVTEALKLYPSVNGMIDGEEIVYHQYADIGIAVSAPKGLMVPVIRNAESMSLAQIESTIMGLAAKARDNKISMEEMTGGTFTITNGGVFGSMLSTPIINPPQSAILGMHNIIERPVAVNGQVVIRPMMYVALSYDHRIIDGRESVGFLVKVKQLLEEPVKLLFAGEDPIKKLLGL